VAHDQPLYTLHAAARGELDYALEYHAAEPPLTLAEGAP
jgi:hypothetical protein